MVIIEENIRVVKVILLKDLRQYLKNNGNFTKLISIKSHGKNINLHPLIIKSLNAVKTVLKKDYGFDEAFNIFVEIDNKCNKLNKYKARLLIRLIQKNAILRYLRIMEDELTDMLLL